MTRLGFAAILCAGAAVGLYAVPMTVTWADGEVDNKDGAAWSHVAVGDVVDSASTIRIGAGGIIELSDGRRKVAIAAEGDYVPDALLRKGAAETREGRPAADKLGRLLDPRSSVRSSAVAAVRGEAVEPAVAGVDWLSEGDSPSGLMEEGSRLARDGDFVAAAAKFEAAAGVALGDDKDGALYSEAWSLAACENLAHAVAVLRSMPPDGSWAGPRALLLARLDIDCGAKAEALETLQSGTEAGLFVGDEVELARSLMDEASAL